MRMCQGPLDAKLADFPITSVEKLRYADTDLAEPVEFFGSIAFGDLRLEAIAPFPAHLLRVVTSVQA